MTRRFATLTAYSVSRAKHFMPKYTVSFEGYVGDFGTSLPLQTLLVTAATHTATKTTSAAKRCTIESL
jgi:hypothetical protein